MTRLTPDDLPQAVRERYGLTSSKPKRSNTGKGAGSGGEVSGRCSCGEGPYTRYLAWERHHQAQGEPGHRWEIDLSPKAEEAQRRPASPPASGSQ